MDKLSHGDMYAMGYNIPVSYNAYSPEDLAVRKRKARRAHHFGVLALFICAYFVWSWKNGVRDIAKSETEVGFQGCNGRAAAPDFDWSIIVPSETLKWHSCFDKFECARLEVPLDYSEPGGEKAAVALTRYPAKVPSTDKKYRGPILFNPGGPGGSGVELITRSDFAERYHTIIGDEYDLIGFDPRGVGHTTPPVRTFPNKAEAAAWILQMVSDANATPDALGHLYGMGQLLGQLADERTRHAAEHVSTAVVSRDMLSIVKAHGQDKLQYWGYSYGTVLGATFAAMFPDNVGRLIIDGVVDSENYYATLWDNNLRDIDSEANLVYQSCVDAGPSICPFYEKSASLVEERVKKLIHGLNITPVPYHNTTSGAYDVIDGSDVKLALFRMMYKPHTAGIALFTALAEIEKGNPGPMAQIYHRAGLRNDFGCECPSTPIMLTGGAEATYAIACGEGDEVHDGIPELQEHYQRMANDSSFFSTLWGLRTYCAGWKIRAKERFTGPFDANTSHPLLLIGNTADPVTPVWNAHKMSRGFKDSVVLTQNSPGHCSVAATSLCTAKYIRQYFRDGTLPPNGTVCEVESGIFNDMLGFNVQTLSEEDRELLMASRGMQQNYFLL